MTDSDSTATLNIPLARKVLEHLTAHPDEHRQAQFGMQTPCGTTACIAGTAVLMDSDTTVRFDGGVMCCAVEVGGVNVDIEQRAVTLLGLGGGDTMDLFYDFNEARARRRFGEIIAAAEAAQQ